MGCRGYLLSIPPECGDEFATREGQQAFVDALDDMISVTWKQNPAWVQETDKAWDAMHRCLGDGTLEPAEDAYPLNRCILGGRRFDTEPEWRLVHFVPATEVLDIAWALRGITQFWMRARYFALTDYEGDLSEADFEYTWNWFCGVREFYQRAADEGRAVIFTVDL